MDALPKVLVQISGQDRPLLRSAAADKDLRKLKGEFRKLRKKAFLHALVSPNKWARIHSAWQKQWVVNLSPNQGAPVIDVKIADRARAEELVKILVKEIETLVFQDSKVLIDSNQKSSRELRKLSCLQVVLLFTNQSKPKQQLLIT